MRRLRYLTAGESHGPALVGILEGLPAHLPLEAADLDRELARRQLGYGRGGRMSIEKDQAEILAGVRFGQTLGSPLGLTLRNRDFANWTERMQVAPGGPDPRPVTVPRPGHADLAGGLKYDQLEDLRNVLERASARETAMRVALGAAAKAFLRNLGAEIGSYVRAIGGVEVADAQQVAPELLQSDASGLAAQADTTSTRALTAEDSRRLEARIDEARAQRDTVGGLVELVATNLPVGLGSYVQFDRKLDGRLAGALASIPAIKAVEIGDGWRAAGDFGSQVHDALLRGADRLTRPSNRAGGLEGGVTNGEPLVLRLAMKPLSTVPAALPSVDLRNLEPTPAHVERTDSCAVPAAGIVAEAVLALELADAVLEALGGDTMASLRLPWARLRLKTRTRPGHVFLIGPPGSGKSRMAALLAKAMNLPCADLDERVSHAAQASIRQLFASEGEAAFREREARALDAVVNEPPAVVALGGGTPLTERAWRQMRRVGAVVRLEANVATLLQRLGEAGLAERPLLAGSDPGSRMAELVRAREPWYARADLAVSTADGPAEAAVTQVLGALRLLQGPLREAGR